MADLLSNLSEDELISQLPNSVLTGIKAIEKGTGSWDVVGALLAAGPTAGIALKGGGRWAGTLWEGVKKEFHSFLCTQSETYDDLRKEWDGLLKKSSNLAVASLSGVIGAQLGVASGVVSPLVIWCLVVALRIGKNAICRALTQQAIDTAAPTSNPAA